MNGINIMNGPEMLRTNPAHAGTAKLSSFIPGQEKVVDGSSDKKMGTFETYLMNAVSEMNNQQIDVNKKTEQFITDPDSIDVHEVTTAMAKAQMSLSLAQTVIDRVVSGWNELSTNR